MNRRRALQLLAALGTTGLAAGCGSDPEKESASPGSPIKIGLVAPQSGSWKAIGDEIVNGFQLFLTLNGQRLGGHPVNLVTADEGDNATTGKAAVDELLKQGVLALTGVANPAVMSRIRDTVEQARVPLIGSNASPSSLQSVVYIWRTSYVLDQPGQALASYLKQQLPPNSRVAILAPEGDDSRDVVEGFLSEFGVDDPRIAAKPIWTTNAEHPGNNAFAYDIEQALRSRPDAIFCYYSGPAAVQFIRQLFRGAGYTGQVYAPGFLTEGTVLNDLKSALVTPAGALRPGSILTALNYSADLNNTANRIFASAYRKTFNASPSTYAMASYDAAQVLNKAIRLAGANPSPQQVNLAMGKIGQIDSPRGFWQFNQPRTPQQKWYLRKVQFDGQLLSNVLINELTTLG